MEGLVVRIIVRNNCFMDFMINVISRNVVVVRAADGKPGLSEFIVLLLY